MNIEDIKLKIKEIQQKINYREEIIFSQENQISILDLDTQIMNIRLLYDQYLVLHQNIFNENNIANETIELSATSNENNASEEVKLPVNQLSMQSLFDFDNDTQPKTSEKVIVKEKQPLISETKETIQIEEPIIQTNKVTEEKTVEIPQNNIPEIQQKSIKEEEQSPIEIDIDNIEFVEDDEEYEEEIIESQKHQSYKESFSPQINPMIDDKEPEIAIPTTKEVLQTVSPEYQSNTIGEVYTSTKKDLNEQFSNNTDNIIANKLQKTQYNDLMKAIDINDKFLFIRELFNGNGSLFTEVINQLNQLSKLTEAIDYFEKIKANYRWKENNDAYNKLYELILKKYSK